MDTPLHSVHSAQWRVEDLSERRLRTWICARRVGYRTYIAGDVVQNAHKRNSQCLKLLTKQNALSSTHAALCNDVPPRFQSAVGGNIKEVKDMVNNHLGEVRELGGARCGCP